MLGFKTQAPRRNLVQDSVLESIQHSMLNESAKPTPYKEVYSYFHKDGKINHAIPREYLDAIPQNWRRHAHRIDFDLVFNDEEKESQPQAFPELSEESKIKLRAIAFGEAEE